MAYVANYEFDVFVSYAHVDNEPFLPGGKGWVTSLIDGLRKLMAVKLGRTDSFSLWMDYALRGSEPVTPQLLNTVRKSVTLLPDSGPVGKVPTDLEGCDDEADEAAVFAGVQGAGGCAPFGAGGDAGECCG